MKPGASRDIQYSWVDYSLDHNHMQASSSDRARAASAKAGRHMERAYTRRSGVQVSPFARSFASAGLAIADPVVQKVISPMRSPSSSILAGQSLQCQVRHRQVRSA
jgi:hypothetical protein